MIIEAKTVPGTKNIPIEQLVNRIGKYLNKNLDGVYKFKIGNSEVNLYLVVYYQIPMLSKRPGEGKTLSDLYEMNFNLNLTSYANKIRVNLIEIAPDEQTVGHFVLDSSQVQDMLVARKIIVDKLIKIINKKFEGYEFIF